jgi:hypothetical protein
MKANLAAYTTAVFALMPAIAQSQGDERALQSGDRVRLWKDGQTQVATLVQASEDEIVYKVESGSPVSVRPDAITALEVSEGVHGNANKGALIGAGVGVGLGLLAAAMASSDEFLSPTMGEMAAAVFITGGAGTLLGMVIGAGIRTEDWTAVPSPWSAATQAGDIDVKVSLAFTIGP